MKAEELRYDENGLIPAIIQDIENNEVLMMAYMDKTAFELTLKTGRAHYWSRSRKKYWMKGESSGHTQEVKEIYFDCDKDTLLIKIKQNVAACHNGYRSCFYRKMDAKTGEVAIICKKIFDEKKVYE
ncbi:MAG: phosphoribosyl-AMP cyclohydrolase [Candidatus Schekmanbacteria bacterium RIFCSPHIGHO2_02_FULL_38_11]|uniref:Phosphoribosyl-AMP cyclohydrolase n=1 Tax=Candidatus Schekmanbacteria bacterium RIFCSPLOWO2_12_FULL_38_15 TaxID=1817883 RepID=A0A1F7SDH9_9BACT|nr:MAG: phosphoribosyl-AMP cyclohydrolase [Candidatus Schekmanbacteria bacterium GWA2_38_9]OGL51288.1 MAG: phosphoribosyl-AMP cyclohydrolase [Candidatus Schekmanbacteria bacterium RIFCSPHIGHO2_02_FULL_38_11]OGL51493.1 MAG: phosphoribosyl-AMP cyclohydrolase [Candidatus Schekmanbacteria bacterium RIFCSPLOWO2_02_FULL_38_14]OGL51843.1 MAG: phosphoribosyl-AMP cyclohydrolase [Candidatus Schekmanbacteria bacterium RIFCSPLOWO2_12_FULL_38_15]